MQSFQEYLSLKETQTVIDITPKNAGSPEYRHHKCLKCQHEFYDRHSKRGEAPICPMCGDFGFPPKTKLKENDTSTSTENKIWRDGYAAAISGKSNTPPYPDDALWKRTVWEQGYKAGLRNKK